MESDEKVFAITLFVADLKRAKDFYSLAFGKSLVFEDADSAVFKFGELLINLLIADQAPSLIAPKQVASKEYGSSFQFTIQVEDVDARIAQLGRMGIEIINGPIDRPWGVRTALVSDPDGYLWEFAQ
jgi:catechol 2,3-dioxygenase-like lactoylglutathione lyase family enzyme